MSSVGTAAPINARVFGDTIAPFSVPHMFWRASAVAASLSEDQPSRFDCLIDDGSHLVLIQKSLAADLSLC